jgi:histidinol-phosphatase (PHP family)
VKNYRHHDWDFELVREDVATALDRIAKTGVAMELNTSGLHKSFAEMNPGPEMLAMICERGIPVVIGSDSHKPHRVAENFRKALNQLQTAGFSKVSVFEKRKRSELNISDVLASLPVA